MAQTIAKPLGNPMKRVCGIRDFSLLFAGQSTSLLGDQFYNIAGAWLPSKPGSDDRLLPGQVLQAFQHRAANLPGIQLALAHKDCQYDQRQRQQGIGCERGGRG